VDFVIEPWRHILGIEVKRASKLAFRDIMVLQTFLDQHSGAFGGLVIYSGNEIRWMGKHPCRTVDFIYWVNSST
jgi:hypothetical protein